MYVDKCPSVDMIFDKDALVKGSDASDSMSVNGDHLNGWVSRCTRDAGTSLFTFLHI
jgi:hypothetical protein